MIKKKDFLLIDQIPFSDYRIQQLFNQYQTNLTGLSIGRWQNKANVKDQMTHQLTKQVRLIIGVILETLLVSFILLMMHAFISMGILVVGLIIMIGLLLNRLIMEIKLLTVLNETQKNEFHVIRNGFDQIVTADKLVVGDLVKIHHGDQLAFDLQLIQITNQLKVRPLRENRADFQLGIGSTILSGEALGIIKELGHTSDLMNDFSAQQISIANQNNKFILMRIFAIQLLTFMLVNSFIVSNQLNVFAAVLLPVFLFFEAKHFIRFAAGIDITLGFENSGFGSLASFYSRWINVVKDVVIRIFSHMTIIFSSLANINYSHLTGPAPSK